MGGGQVAYDFSSVTEMQRFTSKIEAVYGDACDSGLPLKPARTLLLLGCSGNGKSATGNSILRREAFESKGRAAAVTKECDLKTTKQPNGQIINVIDTPGLYSLYPSNESTIQEILKCFRLAKEGIDAVLMVFSLRSRLTEEEKSVLFVLKLLFGNDIVDYMIVIFTNEDSLDDNNETMKEYLEGCPDFKEILTACGNGMVLFDNRLKASESKKAKQVKELLNLVEEVVRKNNEKPFTLDLSHETMESEGVFKEIRAMKGRRYTKQEEAENSDKDQLSQMVKKVETRLMETASLLEQKLNEEKNARLEAENRANKLRDISNEAMKKLSEETQEGRRGTKEKERRLHHSLMILLTSTS